MKLTLRDYQEAAVWRMMAEPTKSILLASEQDTGKTLTVVEFALRMGFQRVLIVGIKDTFEQFRDRTLAQSDGGQTVRRVDSTKAGNEVETDLHFGLPGWYFIGHQLLTTRDWSNIDGVGIRKKYWDENHFDLIIYDEAHVSANHSSRGGKTLLNLDSDWKVAMSGTFYGNKFDNAWVPTKWLWPELIPAYWPWRKERCSEKTIYTGQGKTTKVVTGEKEPGEFTRSLPCYIRYVSGDAVPEPKIIEVDLLPEQREMYDSLENDLLVWIDDHPFSLETNATLRNRLRIATLGTFSLDHNNLDAKGKPSIYFPMDTKSTKLDALWEELALYPDDKVVLGTDSKKFAKVVVARMKARGMRAEEWSGDTSSAQRKALKEAWIADEIQYLVTVKKSFSTGLDWAQTNCWRMGVLSESDDQTDNAQWVKRVFRTGPHKHKFEWFKIQARNTYDFGQYANLELQEKARSITLRGEVIGGS